MAEMGDAPVTLEMIMPAGTISRRRSMGPGWTSSSNSGEKFVPTYLRASTGSCHDFCKYGRKHGFETKSRQLLPKNVARRSLDGGSSADSVVLPERKKTTPSWANAEFSSIYRLSETKSRQPMLKNVARKSLNGGRSVDSVVLPERKKTSPTWANAEFSSASRLSETKSRQSMPKNVARKSLDSGSSVDSVVFPERKKVTSTQLKAKFSSTSRLYEADLATFSMHKSSVESSGFPSPVQREVPNERKKKLLSSPNQREVLNERKKILLAAPKTLPKSSCTTNALKNLKPEASAATKNPEDSVVQVFAKAKERKLPEKSDKILKPKSIKVKPLRSAVSLESSRRKNDPKMGKSLAASREAAMKVVAASTGTLSSNSVHRTANSTPRKHVNLKGVLLKTRGKIKISEHEKVQSEEVHEEIFRQNEEVQEKTLYVIKIENEEIPPQSDQNETDNNMEAVPSSPPKSLSPPTSPSIGANVEDQDVSEYTESEAEDDSHCESDEIGSMEADNALSEGSKKGRVLNLGMLQSKENDPQSTKLSFRRGKIIDIRSESNSPRRLKFRRGRLLGEGQKSGDGLRKNFKRGKEVDGDTTETTQETVVLRHQDVQGKKDAQGLFNNVIEETASKLVETQKSKVKALVGAFETVISLQDGKPSIEC